jgi:ribosome-associated translation inhibitor RaiA
MMFINSRKMKTITRRAPALMAALAVLSLAACASMPEAPLQELQAAELAITSAEQAGVADYSAPQLNQAREKLASARTAVQREDMVLAERLADESKVEADLALASAEMLKAKAVNDDMQDSIDTLKQELQRNSGTRQ